jgi:hypothetical protein
MLPIWHDFMTQLSSASNQAEARKFSRDAKMRSGAPELEVVRSRIARFIQGLASCVYRCCLS